MSCKQTLWLDRRPSKSAATWWNITGTSHFIRLTGALITSHQIPSQQGVWFSERDPPCDVRCVHAGVRLDKCRSKVEPNFRQKPLIFGPNRTRIKAKSVAISTQAAAPTATQEVSLKMNGGKKKRCFITADGFLITGKGQSGAVAGLLVSAEVHQWFKEKTQENKSLGFCHDCFHRCCMRAICCYTECRRTVAGRSLQTKESRSCSHKIKVNQKLGK